ncbi:type II toxin-antitoxin system RelE/ParE family toxin [Candidatus Poribacteria bacterium]|nr:type II toxin-antitoxin system RelE/ParE family toxin [Candidatus Poribacteria bacterium]
MEIRPREVRNYITPDGREPFEEWLDSLKDKKTQTIIVKRIERLHQGHLGDVRRLNGDLYELRIHYGPGYRVYFGDLGGVIVILLCGGAKRTQRRDIQKAKTYWEEFKRRGHG